MAINVEEASGIETFGLAAVDEDGAVRFYLTHGPGSPVGTQAPVPTIYVQEENADIWRKFGPGVNDWEKQGNAGGAPFFGGVSPTYTPLVPGQLLGGCDPNGI